MLKAYINYPNPHVTLHAEGCSTIRQHHKPEQRIVELNINTISEEFKKFANGDYCFGANPNTNDMWLAVDFKDRDFEEAIVKYIVNLLKKNILLLRE